MTKINTRKKLKKEHKQVLIRMLGAGFSGPDIITYFREQYEIEFNKANLSYYRKHKKREIQIERMKVLTTMGILPKSVIRKFIISIDK